MKTTTKHKFEVRMNDALAATGRFTLIACVSLCCLYARSQERKPANQCNGFSRWGLAFDYPAAWKEHPADRVEMMKNYLARELRPYNRNLIEFAMIVGPSDDVALIVGKYTTPKPMQPSEFIEERNEAHEEAKRAGDVTKVNYVKETSVAELPAVAEDVERSNGGRGRTLKIIDGTSVFELSFIAQKSASFSAHTNALARLVSSIVVGQNKGASDQQ